MHFLNCDDNRIVIASLECLQVLFKLMPFRFHTFLIKTGAMSESFVLDKKLFNLNNNSNNVTLDTSHKTSSSSSSNNSLSTQFTLTPHSSCQVNFNPRFTISSQISFALFKSVANISSQTWISLNPFNNKSSNSLITLFTDFALNLLFPCQGKVIQWRSRD